MSKQLLNSLINSKPHSVKSLGFFYTHCVYLCLKFLYNNCVNQGDVKMTNTQQSMIRLQFVFNISTYSIKSYLFSQLNVIVDDQDDNTILVDLDVTPDNAGIALNILKHLNQENIMEVVMITNDLLTDSMTIADEYEDHTVIEATQRELIELIKTMI